MTSRGKILNGNARHPKLMPKKQNHEIRQKRAMLLMWAQAEHDRPKLILPSAQGSEQVVSAEACETAAFFLAWVLGEENIPPKQWNHGVSVPAIKRARR